MKGNTNSESGPQREASREIANAKRGRGHGEFPVVGIGASAGGLEALEDLLENMPIDTGMAFVVVTHQHPAHTSLLPELLGKQTAMPVSEATDGTRLEPNHIYVAPARGNLAILNETLHCMEIDAKASPRLPIDYFFRSLANDLKEHAICIVLSGTGTDGTLGLKAIKGESGMAVVQQSQSAKYAGMPSSAEGTGMADYVLPPAEMPKQLVAYANGPYLSTGTAVTASHGVPPQPMQKIFLLLRSRTSHDFSAYKANTMRRRIERRMNVHQIREPGQYVRYLQENEREIDLLFKELLISVTSFFRDPQSWEALATGPLVQLLESRREGDTIRAWVTGCATGEEVFSLAIVLRECMDKMQRHYDIQIFGTDLDRDAVDLARIGQYPDGIGVDVSPERLERFFTRDENAYRIRKDIREMVIFAQQNVIKDPPFTKLDFLSCRNLLIYLNADLQKRLIPIFHYALKPGGLLMLGLSETIGEFTELFETVDKKWKIFRRKENVNSRLAMPEMPAASIPTESEKGTALLAAPHIREAHISSLLDRLAMARFCPAFVVVNDRGDIIHVHGRTGDYLELAEGQARMNVLDMAREGLSHELAAVMRQAATDEKEVVSEHVRVKTTSGLIHVNLAAMKIQGPESIRSLLMVTFRPVPPPVDLDAEEGNVKQSKTTSKIKTKSTPGSLETLERELQYLRESNQTTLEELETSNEELKSINEEMQSTNEEMESANEELETSKEEMQSLNEELTTVNAELQSKVEDLTRANDDMQNLLNGPDIATIFLDTELHIKRFTEQARKIVTLRPADVDRPIEELATSLKYRDMVRDCREVLDTLVSKDQEVETSDGSSYLMRIIPYRTVDRVIDGLVLTFVNVTELKEAERSGEQRAYFESIFETVRQPLLVLDERSLVASANRSFYETFRLRSKEILGLPLREIGGGEWDIPDLVDLLGDILTRSASVEDYEVDLEFNSIGRKVFLLNARRLDQNTALPGMILLALEDVTASHSK